jgi:hypothetical protein
MGCEEGRTVTAKKYANCELFLDNRVSKHPPMSDLIEAIVGSNSYRPRHVPLRILRLTALKAAGWCAPIDYGEWRRERRWGRIMGGHAAVPERGSDEFRVAVALDIKPEDGAIPDNLGYRIDPYVPPLGPRGRRRIRPTAFAIARAQELIAQDRLAALHTVPPTVLAPAFGVTLRTISRWREQSLPTRLKEGSEINQLDRIEKKVLAPARREVRDLGENLRAYQARLDRNARGAAQVFPEGSTFWARRQ